MTTKNLGKVRLGRESGEWVSAVNGTSILHLFPSSPHPSPPPLFHTAVYSGDLSSTEGGISFPFQMCLFPPRWKSPRPALTESLTQVCSDVPTFLDSIPNTGTVYRLSRECRFPAQVFIRPSLGKEYNRNSLSNTSHYTFPPCQSSYTQTNAEVCFLSLYNIRCKAGASSSYEK